ncbi:unnamed protein product [Nippostrongylus brasiliensis]|uniref:Endo/exonuclease/phosphatase domain-containing protein n=1 Tax=Nippostrongylus brasiliensis TaxID=27835 RepID=A0A0N4YMA5_NIPBR|nr:unnamed protein product [Nippostrongylus brasiliensis]
MTNCTYNALTLASDASVEGLMMQARKIKYQARNFKCKYCGVGPTETGRHRPLHVVFDTEEELLLGTCDSRGVGGVGVLVNTNLTMNIDPFEQLTSTLDYDDEGVEAIYMELEKLHKEDRIFYKVIVGDFNLEGRLSSSCRRTPSVVTRISRNQPPDGGLGSLQVYCITTKLTTLLSTEGFA